MDHIHEVLKVVRNCTDDKKLFEFSRSLLPGVALEVAKSVHAGQRTLENLTRHTSITVRHEVAKNINASAETLKRLSSDKDMLVRDYARRTLVKKINKQVESK